MTLHILRIHRKTKAGSGKLIKADHVITSSRTLTQPSSNHKLPHKLHSGHYCTDTWKGHCKMLAASGPLKSSPVDGTEPKRPWDISECAHTPEPLSEQLLLGQSWNIHSLAFYCESGL